jgi:predicted nuclease of predicted toxin-antitoxin system
MLFLVDARLPAALARWIVASGYHALHMSDVGMSSASDGVIWTYAAERAAIIVTKDEDFARRRILSIGGPNILWLRIRNTRKQELLLRFSVQFAEVIAAFERGETLVEMI